MQPAASVLIDSKNTKGKFKLFVLKFETRFAIYSQSHFKRRSLQYLNDYVISELDEINLLERNNEITFQSGLQLEYNAFLFTIMTQISNGN